MTKASRTTGSERRDNAAIREVMHRARDLRVPDRATLAVGLVGHLATVMNRTQMATLIAELREEAERVQDVRPSREADRGDALDAEAPGREGRGRAAGDGAMAARPGASQRGDASSSRAVGEPAAHEGVGQGGRGEFRSRKLL